MSWLQRKNGLFALKLYVWFYYRISRLQRPRNENWDAHYSLRARSMATNASISQEEFTRHLGTCVFLACVVCPPKLIKGFACAVRYTHMYHACIFTHYVAYS